MQRTPRKAGHNVVPLRSKPVSGRKLAVGSARPAAESETATPGTPEDPRVREAKRLVAAFLAIDDEAARTALIALAEGLISNDWMRRAQRR